MTEPDFSLVKQADIPTAHFARLCGVSRLSATLWLKAQTSPRGLYRTHVLERLAKIKAALDAGKLPLPLTHRSKKYDALVQALEA
jgi:hypothetical protein